MDKYTIYCTAEQTKKALELGAPIYTTNEHLYRHPHEYKYYVEVNIQGNFYAAKIPTTEQMIRWLEEQGIYIIVPIPLIKDFNKNDFSKADAFEYRIVINGNEPYSGEYLTSKEATLAAIDDALEYLSNNK